MLRQNLGRPHGFHASYTAIDLEQNSPDPLGWSMEVGIKDFVHCSMTGPRKAQLQNISMPSLRLHYVNKS